jgi:hypothetical protein
MGGAAHKVVNALIGKGLLKELQASHKLGDPVWRDGGDGRDLRLIVTNTGLAAIGIEAEPQKTKAPKPELKSASAERKTREGTKQTLVIEMLRRPEGATIAEIVEATGWQSHTVRGVMAGALKRKLGLVINSEMDDARGRIYKTS